MRSPLRRLLLALTALSFPLSLSLGCDEEVPAVPLDDAAVGVPDESGTSSVDVSASEGGQDSDSGLLRADPGPSRYALVGEEVMLDPSASTGAVKYQWDFGDGQRWPEPRTEGIARVVYPKPGRYTVVLTAWDAAGTKRSALLVVSVTVPAVFVRSESATLVTLPELGRVAVVSTDSDEVVWVADRSGGLVELARVSVGKAPRSIVRWHGTLAVVCEGADRIDFVPESGVGGPSSANSVALPFGSHPHGAAVVGGDLFVTLAAPGRVARLRMVSGVPTYVDDFAAIEDARAIARLPGERLAVTRFRSSDDAGQVAIVTNLGPSQTPSVNVVSLAFDPQISSDTEIGGVPSYLAQIAVSPTGKELVVPSLQANVGDGVFRNGKDLTFETTMRAVVSFVDLGASTELFDRRKQFDNRGFARAATYSSRGDYLYVAMPGNRTVERLDVLTEVLSGSVADVGFAPDGVALSDDNATLYVNVPLSRELVVYDVGAFDTTAAPLSRVPLVKTEPLSSVVLLGKKLFNDAADPRLSKDGYIACAHCHLDGDSDRRVWDFTGRGEGLRNTTSLLGRAGTGDGPIHWSANFDEVQDFEHDIRSAFEGKGLMTNGDFAVGTRSDKLGDPKAGVSADLDALAAYVASLVEVPRSPSRPGPNQLTDAAVRGQQVFANAGCGTCHSGARFTDSAWMSPGVPKLHDVGTLKTSSGRRLNGTLTGIDTPTLRGVFATPPYLHDGSAPTLRAVLTGNTGGQHGTTSSLTTGQLDDLLEYLRSL